MGLVASEPLDFLIGGHGVGLKKMNEQFPLLLSAFDIEKKKR